jgi:FAD:protein FMN transferase
LRLDLNRNTVFQPVCLLMCCLLDKVETVERRLAAMGTQLAIEVRAPSRDAALAASERAVRAVERVEARLSTWRADSELSALNRAPVGAAVTISADLAADLERCRVVVIASDGAFDPSVGPMVDLWDLRGVGRIPADAELASTRASVGFHRTFALNGRSAVRLHHGARLEEGAFGKGVALDAAFVEWRALEVDGCIDLGGQVAVLGANYDWAIADPRDRARAVVRWSIASGSISTTGNSERARTVDGVRIGHVLDPRTGRPARDFGSVSIGCESAARADALSTAAFVLGPDAAFELAAREHVDVLVIELEGEVLRARASSSLRTRLAPLAPDLALTFVDPTQPAGHGSCGERPLQGTEFIR